jgi:hypothetical protein
MFAFKDFEAKRAAWRRAATPLIVGAASLLLGACAHNVADAPGLQWQVTTIEGADAQEGAAEASAGASSSLNCEQADHCYVYRGGRDPLTGLALTQL